MIRSGALPLCSVLVIVMVILPSSLGMLPRLFNHIHEKLNKDNSNAKRSAEDHCEDTGDAKDCAWWNEQGYCADDSEFHDAMVGQCAKTCGCKELKVEVAEEVLVVKREC